MVGGLAHSGRVIFAAAAARSANVLSTTLRQIVIPATQLARTTGAYRQFMFGSIPLGSALGGILGGSLGSRTGVALGTLGLAVSALPMLARSIRSLRDPHDAAARVLPPLPRRARRTNRCRAGRTCA